MSKQITSYLFKRETNLNFQLNFLKLRKQHNFKFKILNEEN